MSRKVAIQKFALDPHMVFSFRKHNSPRRVKVIVVSNPKETIEGLISKLNRIMFVIRLHVCIKKALANKDIRG